MDDPGRDLESLDEHKGELTALTCFVTAIFRALPLDLREDVLGEFDTEREGVRVDLLNSGTTEAVLRGYDRKIRALNRMRFLRPDI